MNLNKFDFYKNSVYFLIANAVVDVLALVIGIIFGVNYNTSIVAGNLLFSCVMSVLLSLIAIFLFVGFTTSFAKAFSIVLIVANNVLLSTALIVLLRVPVSESIVMGYILLVAISTLFALLSSQSIKDISSKSDKNEMIKNSLKEHSKVVFFTSITFVAVLLLGLIITSQSMFDLVREFLVMMAVIVYTYLTIQSPVLCYMSTKIHSKKKAKTYKKSESEKMAQQDSLKEKAEAQENPIEENLQDGANIEQNIKEENNQ
ncbi:MAG: hypothetical protein ACI4TZ_00640 [Christensenellales bacterium]